jgi:hypothetical protein
MAKKLQETDFDVLMGAVKLVMKKKKIVDMEVFSPPHDSSKDVTPFTPLMALSLLLELHWSKGGYEQLRMELTRKNANILPSYYQILKEKQLCRPALSSFIGY